MYVAASDEEAPTAREPKAVSDSGFVLFLYRKYTSLGLDAKLSGVLAISTLLAGVYLLSGILSYLLAVLMVHLSQRIVYILRKQVFDHLTVLPVNYFDTHQTGDIISRISYDVDTLNASITHDVLQISTSFVTVIGSLIYMIRISPLLLTVFLITIPATILVARMRTKKMRPLVRERSRKLGELNGYAEEMLSGQKTIKAYNRERVIGARFDQRNTDAVNAYYRAEYVAAMLGPSVRFISNLSLALIAALGGIFYMLSVTGQVAVGTILWIDLGMIASFILYSKKFSGPINEFANILSDLQSACAAAERIFTLLDEKPEKLDDEDAVELTDVRGEITFDHVRFGYVEGKTILHDLSLDVRPGNLIAIVGPTGAGKTTVINLLMRFYDVNDGEIRIDGVETRKITRESLRRAYTMVLQETWLFKGTIYENITYGKENATREEVVRAAKAAKVHSFIEALPNGYDTVLSDDGVNISKGQKQLITIARAMLSDSEMLILDEATSNVDSRTEMQIQEAMYALMKGRTCFVIAHRLSTIQNADTILVLKDGDVIEQGSHDELMAKNGFYSSLYRSQFD
ncbi:MAG: ABC transporter ATP-binding protein [Clostridia bacterium]|nr:ABC transporter ATP-binding protein [Clostridia bacterium]